MPALLAATLLFAPALPPAARVAPAVVDAQAYGVVPDDRRDDAAALNAALRAARPGDVVAMPAGTLHLDRPVVLERDGVALRGAGAGRTRLVSRITARQAGDDGAVTVRGEKGDRFGQTTQDARQGTRAIAVAARRNRSAAVGQLVWLGAPNEDRFLRSIGTERWSKQYPWVRQTLVPLGLVRDSGGSAVLGLRDPLDLALPAGADVFLARPVRGAVLEGFTVTQEVPGARREQVQGVYENVFPQYQVPAVVWMWTEAGTMRDVAVEMAGGHAVVIENTYGLRANNVSVDGAWNKGEGGTGYVRIARAYRCDLSNLTVRNIRHVAFQWSAAYNTIRNSRLFVDVNFHGGFSRYNVVTGTSVTPPASHPWAPVIKTRNDAHWAPPDGPGNRVDGYAAVFPGDNGGD